VAHGRNHVANTQSQQRKYVTSFTKETTMKLHAKQSGFSILEMMLVMSIVVFLAVMIVPRITSFIGRIGRDKTKLILSDVYGAISRYSQDMGHAPQPEEGGLKALVTRPKGPTGQDWNGPYLPSIPVDNFKKEFYYAAPPRKFKNIYKKFEVYSMGDDDDDDLSNELRQGA
jgi:general secretion pathway protein G